MAFSLPSLSQMVKGLARRWIGFPVKGDFEKDASRDSENENEKDGDCIEKPDVEAEEKQEGEKGKESKEEKSEIGSWSEEKSEASSSQIGDSVEKESVLPMEEMPRQKIEEAKLEDWRETEIILVENKSFEEEDSLLDITAQIVENVLEDVWSSHQSCVEDPASHPSLAKSNDTIADL